jgi:cholesterol 7-dehydrogenase
MTFRGEKHTIVNMHLNEFVENSTDFQHFASIHSNMIVPFTLIEIPGLTINHHPTWTEGKLSTHDSHMSWFKDTAELKFCGIDIPYTAAFATIDIIGNKLTMLN